VTAGSRERSLLVAQAWPGPRSVEPWSAAPLLRLMERSYRESAALPGPWLLLAAELSKQPATEATVSSWLRTVSSSRTSGASLSV